MNSQIVDRLLETENLPSLPTVAAEILRLTRSDDVTVDALVKVVQQDPALTAKLLKVVNSALFSLPREVGSLKQAMVILGLRSVKVMALSFSLVEALRTRPGDIYDIETYWRRSLTSAVAARLIAKAANPKIAEEAFVAGLLADIGEFTLWRAAPDDFARSRKTGGTALEGELAVFGMTHAVAGGELLSRWNLPRTLCEAVGAHHGEGLDALDGQARQLAACVCAAHQIAEMFTSQEQLTKLEEVIQNAGVLAGVERATLDGILHGIDMHVRSTADLLSLKVGSTISYAQLQAESISQLARISMQAEFERAAIARTAEAASAEVNRLSAEKREILEMAATDSLTKVANRAAFDKRLAEEIGRAAANKLALGLIMVDIDHFKRFNDEHGHRAGDEVLRHVAACLQRVASGAGLVARYGGEEFAVIAIDRTAEQVRNLAEQIRKAIESSHVAYQGQSLRVTASLGASLVRPAETPSSPATLVESADQRLYAAKRGGRNQVEFASKG
ncbi:MAG: GGDEF domain-containing protein [Planctomycetes bacterium]|nr:GGDEF domain-containing protein [Planctomycetota bacterium]